MPATSSRALTRTDKSVGSRWLRLRARMNGPSGDDGFTMVEMIVALVIIGIIMTALGSFFVSTVSATSRQGTNQVAVQLADDAIERVRAMDPTAITTGRDQTSSTLQWNTPVTGVSTYENDMTMAYDTNPNVTSGGATATLPTVGSPVTVNGLTYNQNWYIGKCWQPLGGGTCTVVANPTVNTYASFYRVVVAITWSDTVCANSKCVFIASTLVSNAQYDPQFNSNLVAQPPSVVNPNNQTSDLGVPDSLTLNSSGGAGAITWTQVGMPDGMSLVNGVISGTPTKLGNYSVTVTATDQFALHGTAAFSWTVIAPPAVTATAQTSEVGVADSYTATCTCTGTVTWTASSLPPGISINSVTGAMSGTPTTANPTGTTVTVTATDAQGGSSSPTFNWIVYSPMSITTPAGQAGNAGTAITAVQVTATGGSGSYTWTSSDLPSGLSISSTGRITGTPATSAGGTHSVTVTATDSVGATATTGSFAWTVYTPLNAGNLSNQTSPANVAISTLTVGSSGGHGGNTWRATNLPPGLSIDSGTGAITGSPNTPGIYSVTLTVTDSVNATDTASATWTVWGITSPTNTIWSDTSTAVTVTPRMAFGSATDSYTWSFSSGSGTNKPPVSTFNTGTGAMSGTTPSSAGTYTFTLSVKDNTTGQTASIPVTWTLSTGPVVTGPNANQFTAIGDAITAVSTGSANFTVSGTTTYTATGLPGGITLSTAGAFTGSPSSTDTPGVYTVTVTAKRGTGGTAQTALATFTWTIETLSITAPSGNRSNTHSTTITPVTASVTGGTGTLVWSATGLPNSNLSINPATGTISGSVSSTKTSYNTVITVTDGYGIADTQSFTWTIS